MKKIEKKDIWLFAAQVAVWALVLFAMPLATFLSTQDVNATRTSFYVVWGLFQAPLVVYFANFYLLGPYLFFMMFLVLNCVIVAVAIGIRHFIRTRQIRQQLKEEKAKNTEAELAWLKRMGYHMTKM